MSFLIMEKITHKVLINRGMQATKGDICKLLGLTLDAYEVLRYELSIAWLQYQGYFEATARLFILSRTFFTWYYQRLHEIDLWFVRNYDKNSDDLLQKYMEKGITMNLRPSRMVLEAIRKEGFRLLQEKPHFKNIKIF